jgi:triacylglycerol lipase
MFRTHLIALFFSFLALPALAAPKPVLFLIPGAGSSGDRIYLHKISWPLRLINGDKYFGKLQKALKKGGVPSQVCPKSKDQDTRTLEERADECARQILESQGGTCTERSVMLMGHSMGGLIARLLAQDTRVRDCIHSVTTVATPHQGTPIADFSIEHVDQDTGWGRAVKFVGYHYQRTRYLPQLRVDRSGYDSRLFSAQDMPDNPEVSYYSFSESMKKIPEWPLEIMRGLIEDELVRRGLDKTEFGVKNDGVVPEYSMVYGKYLGHLEVHHFASACSSRPKLTGHCETALSAILPHLRGIWRGLYRSLR